MTLLLATAAVVGFLHALLGPDHYVPFVAMARAGEWSRRKTLLVTLACGLGHLLSSVALGVVGVALGLAVAHLTAAESFRGQVAAWAFATFGLVYLVWGLRRARRGGPHTHVHVHADGTVHRHLHAHGGEHVHIHAAGSTLAWTPWILFTVFVFGPCEPLIPLVMVPAAQGSWIGVALVTGIFGLATLGTMLAVVLLLQAGLARLPLGGLDRYAHALAGAAILLCGAGMLFLGL